MPSHWDRLALSPGRPLDPGGPPVGRVVRVDFLPAELGDLVVRGDRGLAHADRDQCDLALVAGDVARRVDARQRGPARHRVDPDLALAFELEAPLGDRAEV